MVRPFTLKQANSLTFADTLSCLVDREVTHQTAVREFLGSSPGSGKDFNVCSLVFVVVVCLLCLSETYYLS